MKFTKGRNCLVDTDGWYVVGDINIDELNSYLDKFIKETFKVKKNFMMIEKDGPYQAGFFLKKKNYLLIKNDKFIKHGSAYLHTTPVVHRVYQGLKGGL